VAFDADAAAGERMGLPRVEREARALEAAVIRALVAERRAAVFVAENWLSRQRYLSYEGPTSKVCAP
jgi:hypothetical protein